MSKGMRAEISQQWETMGETADVDAVAGVSSQTRDGGITVASVEGGEGRGRPVERMDKRIQDGPATQRRGSGQPLEHTSRLGLEGFDPKTLIERRTIDMIPLGPLGSGVVDVMRDIFAHLMQKKEAVCRTMQKRRETGKTGQKRVEQDEENGWMGR
jgi:hypothetical protein